MKTLTVFPAEFVNSSAPSLSSEFIVVKMSEEKEEDELQRLRERLEAEPQNADHHIEIGLFLWNKGQKDNSKEMKEKAAESFVVSARLNPKNGVAFRHLGHYYSQVSVDLQRASKCYLRAVNLCPEDFESGENLCDLLDREGKESLEISICREASDRSPKAFWALRRFGYLLVQQKKWAEAVQSLQKAIRGYPTCADLWECLGLAYQRLGMLTAAIKSYGRAIDLEDSKIFALIETGNIHLMLGSFREGVELFRRSLEISPANISGQFGLSSALLGLSKECISSGAFSWAASLLEEASCVAEASTRLAGNYSSLWKLLGDIKITFAKCLPWVEDVESGESDQDFFENSIQQWRKAHASALETAKCAYQNALHLSPWEANSYTDLANSLHVMDSFEVKEGTHSENWQLPEKMVLGGLTLERGNSEFWEALGCLSPHPSLKQHALIRGLQLDVSRSSVWAFLGKLYRKSGDKQLSKQSFDRARSINPSLALPWAGMAAAVPVSVESPNEAYESCLRAVQLLPLPEFQLGLGKLASLSGHLISPQVLGALNQAVQRAPYIPESHNLKGLSWEARGGHQSAIISYKNALHASYALHWPAASNQVVDISVNLARTLCKAGRASDAEEVCYNLISKGLLDNLSHQIYIMALWQQGKKELSLTEAARLVRNIQKMDPSSGAVALSLTCKLVYFCRGQDLAVRTILKNPKEVLQISKIRFLVAALCASDPRSPLLSLFSEDSPELSRAEAMEMVCLATDSKMLDNDSHVSSRNLAAQRHLRKALHKYPDSVLIRKKLGSFMLCGKDSRGPHSATRCISSGELLASAYVACCGGSMCGGSSIPLSKPIRLLQKWLHEEPWNQKARYLLVLTMMQRVRKEKYPPHLCLPISRVLSSALEKETQEHQKLQLLLCSSEICLQTGVFQGCIAQATEAARLEISDDGCFFPHLQLCRAYSTINDLQNLKIEYLNCLKEGTHHEIGWLLLKLLESKYKLWSPSKEGEEKSPADQGFAKCLEGNDQSMHTWMCLYDLVRAQSYIWAGDFLLAEQTLADACTSISSSDRCLLLLCHGAICMELARWQAGSRFLSLALRSLTRAWETSAARLPIVSALLAQAVGSSGNKDQWSKNLQSEWSSWPAERRPPEVYFQMHLLSEGSDSKHFPDALGWLLRSIHMNPSSQRYWKALRMMVEG